MKEIIATEGDLLRQAAALGHATAEALLRQAAALATILAITEDAVSAEEMVDRIRRIALAAIRPGLR